ncbi:hypothetical protein BOTBODRAFT_178151 [Botryobasidium botryosum FD-172 SS1]|uniref:Uncharacterized protein n=1 Tax=Botryobasidium botryosum (strain FD-172 SS1) TaxID=930990 RepID=A0A067M3Y6_BOTB1|nr:hypothetical protein BOTBODRAFT_178151 [Botryobasidium botryosum FD-172 SS1]
MRHVTTPPARAPWSYPPKRRSHTSKNRRESAGGSTVATSAGGCVGFSFLWFSIRAHHTALLSPPYQGR